MKSGKPIREGPVGNDDPGNDVQKRIKKEYGVKRPEVQREGRVVQNENLSKCNPSSILNSVGLSTWNLSLT